MDTTNLNIMSSAVIEERSLAAYSSVTHRYEHAFGSGSTFDYDSNSAGQRGVRKIGPDMPLLLTVSIDPCGQWLMELWSWWKRCCFAATRKSLTPT